MSAHDRNNPLHGVGLDAMFSEILRHYHWEVLAEQLKFKCLSNHPSFEAAIKFLKKTQWAREKTEAFYLYRFKQLPIPSDEEHELPPRERSFPGGLPEHQPAEIKLGDKEFFDDPISGPKFSNKSDFSANKRTRHNNAVQSSGGAVSKDREKETKPKLESSDGGHDPWAKWK